jgi:hypothetical protein
LTRSAAVRPPRPGRRRGRLRYLVRRSLSDGSLRSKNPTISGTEDLLIQGGVIPRDGQVVALRSVDTDGNGDPREPPSVNGATLGATSTIARMRGSPTSGISLTFLVAFRVAAPPQVQNLTSSGCCRQCPMMAWGFGFAPASARAGRRRSNDPRPRCAPPDVGTKRRVCLVSHRASSRVWLTFR